MPEPRGLRDRASNVWKRDRFRVLPQSQFGFSLLFRFDSGAKQFLEEAFLHQSIDGAVVDNGLDVE
jgi:hypothetical protein